jgi:hypothetical protein
MLWALGVKLSAFGFRLKMALGLLKKLFYQLVRMFTS